MVNLFNYTDEMSLPFKSIFGIKTVKYRIVLDRFGWYLPQKRHILWPFWVSMWWESVATIEKAEKIIRCDFKGGTVVKE